MKAALILLGSFVAVATFAADPVKAAPAPLGELGKPKPKPPALKNGGFNEEKGGQPEHWKSAYHTGSFSVVKDGADPFLRVEVKDKPANGGVVQTIPIPPGTTEATVRGKMRGKPGKKEPKAAAQLVFWPKGDKETIPPTIIASEHSAAWKTEIRTIEIPPGAKTLEVSARCVFATGKFDFDDIDVQFK